MGRTVIHYDILISFVSGSVVGLALEADVVILNLLLLPQHGTHLFPLGLLAGLLVLALFQGCLSWNSSGRVFRLYVEITAGSLLQGDLQVLVI